MDYSRPPHEQIECTPRAKIAQIIERGQIVDGFVVGTEVRQLRRSIRDYIHELRNMHELPRNAMVFPDHHLKEVNMKQEPLVPEAAREIVYSYVQSCIKEVLEKKRYAANGRPYTNGRH